MSAALPSAPDHRPSSRWLLSGVAALLALSIGVQVVRDRGWQPYQPATPLLWFQSGAILKRLSLGFENVVADIYWIRAVLYYGGKRRSAGQALDYSLLDPLLTLVTDLDSRFKVAYRFGAIFLTEAYPDGPGQPDRAIALLQRGIDANPAGWEYMHDIGFIYYWWLKDYQKAAQSFEQGARLPGAPDWLGPLAATTLARGGDRVSSRTLWRQLRDTTDVDWVRSNAQLRLLQIDAMDVVDELNGASQQFAIREGHPPRLWRELIVGERLRGIPVDPTGVPFELDAATGRIDVSRKSALWPLPADQPAVTPGGRP